MAKKKSNPQYKVVNFVDVNELLSFAKEEYKELEEQIKEEKRVEDELKEFISTIEKHSDHKIHFIGHEKRYGNHLVRFLLKDGGFIEVIAEKPLALNAHFYSKEQADKFAKGLKKALEKHMPNHPVKDMVINNIKVEDGFRDDVLTLNKWSRMHKIAIHKTVVVTIVTIIVFLIIEMLKEILRTGSERFLHFESFIISFAVAAMIAFFFEPIKEKVEHYVEKFLP